MGNRKSNLIFLIAGVACIIAGILFLNDVKGEFVKTEAVISSIESYYDEMAEEEKHFVYVDYTVDGKEYQNIDIGTWSSSMKEGETIKIMYDVWNPERAIVPFARIAPFVPLTAGILILLFFGLKLVFILTNGFSKR